jgi:hypothetical protein
MDDLITGAVPLEYYCIKAVFVAPEAIHRRIYGQRIAAQKVRTRGVLLPAKVSIRGCSIDEGFFFQREILPLP